MSIHNTRLTANSCSIRAVGQQATGRQSRTKSQDPTLGDTSTSGIHSHILTWKSSSCYTVSTMASRACAGSLQQASLILLSPRHMLPHTARVLGADGRCPCACAKRRNWRRFWGKQSSTCRDSTLSFGIFKSYLSVRLHACKAHHCHIMVCAGSFASFSKPARNRSQ